MTTLALCIPAYNASWSLPTLFASVGRQAIPFDEVLVYDDASTDNTAFVAKAHGATVIAGTSNRGCSFGKNQLAQHAKSDWLFFLDSDDELLPEFASCVRPAVSANSAKSDLILLNYVYFDGVTNQIKQIPEYDLQLLVTDPLRFMITHRVINSAVVYRKKFLSIGGFDTDPQVLFNEDRAFSIKTALNDFRYEYLETPCIRINYYANSMSANQPVKWIQASVNLWEKIAGQVNDEYRADVCNALFIEAIWAAMHRDWLLVKRALGLAKELKADAVPSASVPFQVLFRLWPFGAYYFREQLFGILKKNR